MAGEFFQTLMLKTLAVVQVRVEMVGLDLARVSSILVIVGPARQE